MSDETALSLVKAEYFVGACAFGLALLLWVAVWIKERGK